MNAWFNGLKIACLSLAVIAANACLGIEELASNFASKAEEKIAVDTSFNAVVTEVSSTVGEAISDAAASALSTATGGAPGMSPAASFSETINVNETATALGGTVNVTGTLAINGTYDAGGGTVTEDIDLKAVFADLNVDIGGTTHVVAGEQNVSGTVTVTSTGASFTVDGQIKNEGFFTIDGGKQYEFDVDVVLTETGYTWSGTVDGQPVEGTGTFNDDSDNDNQADGDTGATENTNTSGVWYSCVIEGNGLPKSSCGEWVGASYADDNISDGCVRDQACDRTGAHGQCIVGAGTDLEIRSYSFNQIDGGDLQQQLCTGAQGGTYTAY